MGFGGPSTPNDPPDAEVRRLVETGHKIEAIKLVRQQTGLGLKEAKDQVDALARHLNAGRPPAANSPKGGQAAVLAIFLLLVALGWYFWWRGKG